jgi:hypothetical protein
MPQRSELFENFSSLGLLHLIYVFPEIKLRGFVPNSCIRVSVTDIYFQDQSAYLAAAK